MANIRQKAVLCWGKMRRAFLVALRKNRVREMLERRRGECARCGACCKLLFRCPSYDDSDGSPRCLTYNDRPGACGLFPLNEEDLRDRNIVMPGRKCGYYFEDFPAGGNGNGKHPPLPPLRWGPPKTHPNGKRKYIRGAFAVLWSSLFRSADGNGNGNGNGNGKSHA
jgi:hypothetical protein